MIKEFAEFKSKDLAIRLYFANGQTVEGKIKEINPEFVLIDNDGKLFVCQTCNILYYHAV